MKFHWLFLQFCFARFARALSRLYHYSTCWFMVIKSSCSLQQRWTFIPVDVNLWSKLGMPGLRKSWPPPFFHHQNAKLFFKCTFRAHFFSLMFVFLIKEFRTFASRLSLLRYGKNLNLNFGAQEYLPKIAWQCCLNWELRPKTWDLWCVFPRRSISAWTENCETTWSEKSFAFYH